MNRVHRPHYTTQSLFWHASRRYQKRGAGLLSSLLQAEIDIDGQVARSSPDHLAERRLAAGGLLDELLTGTCVRQRKINEKAHTAYRGNARRSS